MLGAPNDCGDAATVGEQPGDLPNDLLADLSARLHGRLACCLLVTLPGEVQCGTCNLRDRDQSVAALTAWARTERARQRTAARAG